MKTPQLKKEDFSSEEMEKCVASPRYFYNKYWKIYDKEGNEIPKKELTEEEWNERTAYIERMRNTPIRRRNMDRPLLPAECFEKLPSFLKAGWQKKLKEKNDYAEMFIRSSKVTMENNVRCLQKLRT